MCIRDSYKVKKLVDKIDPETRKPMLDREGKVVKAVSYTHLDVYKRQTLPRNDDQARRGVGMRIETDKIYCGDSLQVLQTLPDVYKRQVYQVADNQIHPQGCTIIIATVIVVIDGDEPDTQ